MAAVNPAPGKGYIRTRPTPLVGDVLFYELRDRDVATNQTPPTYGAAHPDTRLWPVHKLVLVEPADVTGWEKWWYAADRDNQDTYNFEFTRDEDRELIVRTRIIPRADARWATPALGAAESYLPTAVFAGASGHVLVERRVQQIDDEKIRSIYAVEILIYEQLPGDTKTKEVDEGCYHYYTVTKRVLSSSPGTVPAGPVGSVLVSSSFEPDPKNSTVSIWTARYEVLPSGVWNETRTVGEAEVAIARQRVETASPGTRPSLPGGYTELAYSLKETEQCLVSEWEVMGEELPGPTFFTERKEDDSNTLRIYTQRVLTSTPGSGPSIPGTHSLISQRFEATDNNLVSKWVVTCRVLPAVELAGYNYDEDSGKSLPFTSQVLDVSELPTPLAPQTGVDVDGYIVEYTPIDQFQTRVTKRMATPDGTTETTEVSDYVYSFPNVLRQLNFSPINRQDGRDQIRVHIEIQEGGSRYCRATIVEQWFKDYPGQPALPVAFIEDGFVFQGANLQFSVPPCLHGGYTIYDNVGSEDPVFEQQSYTLYVEATNYVTIPSTFVAKVSQTRQRGGWKRTTVTVQTPADLL